MKITSKTIEHSQQRYDTIGDWRIDRKGNIHVKVSKVHNDDFEFLISIHEQIEAFFCQKHGISGKEVDAFDLTFRGEGEPGDDRKAPYHKEHVFATKVEKMLAAELGIEWNAYDEYINKF
jgi:hypothetical protein